MVRVELYADGVNGDEPVRQEMTRGQQLVGANGYIYQRTGAFDTPGCGLYGASDTALPGRCGSSRSCSHLMAAVISIAGCRLRIDEAESDC